MEFALIGAGLAAVVIVTVMTLMAFRRVVPTNMVHIVQSKRSTTSYGKGHAAGNVYLKWPKWMPNTPRFFPGFLTFGGGVHVIVLPVSNFDLSLDNYEAYDVDRVPFVVDIVAFFRIADTTKAAQRVESIRELQDQLLQIVQGAVRKVLAGDNIDQIMLERAKFGQAFTNEVKEQLKEWGVEPVKSMELMDIRDGGDSMVVANIMAKKTSEIEKESRVEVAGNIKTAQEAEIDARRAVEIREQEAQQAVGERTAEKEKAVGVATERAAQDVLIQRKETAEKDMDRHRVVEVRKQKIEKDRNIELADQEKQTTILVAEGQLAAKQKEAEGIRVEGEARGDAEKAIQLAPVAAQITLAKEIGTNEGYQSYLVRIEGIRVQGEVGKAQAAALQAADVKVIANAGTAPEGMTGIANIISPAGGTSIAGMLEAIGQTPAGKAALEAVGVAPDEGPNGETKRTPGSTV